MRNNKLIVLIFVSFLWGHARSFSTTEQQQQRQQQQRHRKVVIINNASTSSFTHLFATKKSSQSKKKKARRPSTSGFGGAAADSCPCGSDKSYMKCCGLLHKKVDEFMKAEPEAVVRARYSAYAKREIDFIIQSTHPKNKNFDADIKHWRKQIDTNCYDNFELTKCQILDHEMIDKKTATVSFVANMMQRDSREKTAFMEKSTFEKVGGAWLYKEGEIGDPPGREKSTDESDESDETGQEAKNSETTTAEASTTE